jgi:uncharacterized membrane protein
MSRQQFLAELNQYLTFVTSAEREAIVSAFEQRFDNVGAEGESALIMELGTPMAIAIALKRRKEAGELIIPGATLEPAEEEPEASEEQEDEAAETQLPGQLELSLGDEDAPLTAQDDIPGFLAENEPGAVRETASDDEEASILDEIPGIGSKGTAPSIEREPAPPPKRLSSAAAFGATLLSAVFIVVFGAFTILGGWLVVVGGNFTAGGLQTLSTVPEALWMFTIGLGALALGVLLFWFSIWACISLIRRLYFGPTAKRAAFRRRMSGLWRAIWIMFTVLAVLGAVCGYFAFTNGTEHLIDPANPRLAGLLDWFFNNPVTRLILSVFGL